MSVPRLFKKSKRTDQDMYKIVRKKELNSSVTLMDIEAPFIARKAKAGQFIIFRVDDMSERVKRAWHAKCWRRPVCGSSGQTICSPSPTSTSTPDSWCIRWTCSTAAP